MKERYYSTAGSSASKLELGEVIAERIFLWRDQPDSKLTVRFGKPVQFGHSYVCPFEFTSDKQIVIANEIFPAQGDDTLAAFLRAVSMVSDFLRHEPLAWKSDENWDLKLRVDDLK